MKPYREIEFTTTRSHNGLTVGKTCYQGHLQHNAVLPEKETREQFAEYCGEDRSRTDRYLNALGEFIARKISYGHRLNFGSFAVELKLLGGFQGANAPFEEERDQRLPHSRQGAQGLRQGAETSQRDRRHALVLGRHLATRPP